MFETGNLAAESPFRSTTCAGPRSVPLNVRRTRSPLLPPEYTWPLVKNAPLAVVQSTPGVFTLFDGPNDEPSNDLRVRCAPPPDCGSWYMVDGSVTAVGA